MLFVVKRSLTIELSKDQGTIKNSKVPVTVKLHNKSFFFITKLIVHVTMENELTGERKKEQLIFAMNPFQQASFTMYFQSSHSGKVNIHISSMTLYDLFGFLKVVQPLDKRTDVFVFPTSYQIADQSKVKNIYEQHHLLEETTQRTGTSNEYLNIRPYVAGDSVKQIHWKLSSKLDEIVIKETSDTKGDAVFLLFESVIEDIKAKPSVEQIDTMFELFVSFIKTFLQEKNPVSIAWFNDKSGSLQIETLEHEQQLERLMPTLLQIKFTSNQSNVLQQYKNTFNAYNQEVYYFSSNAQLGDHEKILENKNVHIIKVVSDEKSEARSESETVFSRKDLQDQFT